MVDTQENALDGLARSFGFTVLGKLDSADDVIAAIVSTPGATDGFVEAAVARLRWVRSVHRVTPASNEYRAIPVLPRPDSRQLQALKTGKSILVSGLGENGISRLYVVRALPSGNRLYTEISFDWLWADASDFAMKTGLLTFDDQGTVLNAAGTLPPDLSRAEIAAFKDIRRPGNGAMAHGSGTLPDGWTFRSWEAFLGGRFSSPSWYLVAVAPPVTLLARSNDSHLDLLAFAVLTILLIAWLSIATIRKQLYPLDLLTKATQRVSQRDFDAFQEMTWNDEFGDLARSFREMSKKLKMQFSALEMLSEVDRLLLQAPQLEQILDKLLPQMAAVLHSEFVTVILFDPDSDEHARAYDYLAEDVQQRPIRRIATDVGALKAISASTMVTSTQSKISVMTPFFAPIAMASVKAIRLHPLKHSGHGAGLLCIGYRSEARVEANRGDSGVGIVDLADRLSLILANLKQSESLHRQANYDALTGLQNRHAIAERVRGAVAAARAGGGSGAVLYLDLDHFKPVNDTAGHAAGDKLLRVVGARLTECVGDDHCVARLAGDEFAVLLPSVSEPDEARLISERIIASLQRPIAVNGREHLISASIGIAVFPIDGATLEDLLKASDIAMYQAKGAGRGRAMFFRSEMQRHLEERLKIESGMHRALIRQDFVLHYQPIVSETECGAIGLEALVRWPGGEPKWISPGSFIPIAEENGLIVELGDWILRSACRQFAIWRSDGVDLDYVSVNVSVRQLREGDFLARLLSALKHTGIRGEDLQIEITESVLADGGDLRLTLAGIADQGVRLALDDFGTGYSSLSYLRTYPIDTVKIDRSFVQDLPREAAACQLAESIVVMCAALEKNVVAEGVETEAQKKFLHSIGCRTFQGYLLGRPMDASDIPGFVRRLRSAAFEETESGNDLTSRSA